MHPARGVRRFPLKDLQRIEARRALEGFVLRVVIGDAVLQGAFVLVQTYLVPEVLCQAACGHLGVDGQSLFGRQAAIHWLDEHGASVFIPAELRQRWAPAGS